MSEHFSHAEPGNSTESRSEADARDSVDHTADAVREPVETAGPAAETTPPALRRTRLPKPPGPGLFEAVLWSVGFLALQLAGMLLTVFVVLVYEASINGPERMLELTRDQVALNNFVRNHQMSLFVGVQAFMVIAALGAARLRLGSDVARRLALARVPVMHFVLLVLMVAPLQIVSSGLYLWAEARWEPILELYPAFEGLEAMRSVDFVEALSDRLPLLTLIGVLAVAPAVAEEVVFRGVVGRGLAARWGLPVGIAVTSLLFAAAHLYPPHAVALLPLAVFIHVAYFASRSFWAPMLIHFLNNFVAAMLLHHSDRLEGNLFAETEPPPLSILITAILCVVLVTRHLWRTRISFRRADGGNWDPGYTTVELPPRTAAAELAEPPQRYARSAGLLQRVLTVLALAAFYAAFAAAALELS